MLKARQTGLIKETKGTCKVVGGGSDITEQEIKKEGKEKMRKRKQEMSERIMLLVRPVLLIQRLYNFERG